MKVSIGLPNAVPETSGERLIEWARRADGRGFASLGTLDRIRYDNYEPMTALAAAAAVTERIDLCTAVLLGPLRTNDALLAKQALTLNALSGGRFTLGIALGGRDDDYEIGGVEPVRRGARLSEQLERIREVWDGGDVGPRTEGRPGLVVGGHADASFKRAARFGDGWVAGGVGPDEYAELVNGFLAAWEEAGREGEPRTQGLAYYGLGPDGEKHAQEDLTHYYAWLGEDVANMIAASAATDPDTVRQYVSAFERAGCGELIFFPTASDPEQVDLLADAAGIQEV